MEWTAVDLLLIFLMIESPLISVAGGRCHGTAPETLCPEKHGGEAVSSSTGDEGRRVVAVTRLCVPQQVRCSNWDTTKYARGGDANMFF